MRNVERAMPERFAASDVEMMPSTGCPGLQEKGRESFSGDAGRAWYKYRVSLQKGNASSVVETTSRQFATARILAGASSTNIQNV